MKHLPRYKVYQRYLKIISRHRDIYCDDVVNILRSKGASWTSFQYGWLKEFHWRTHHRTFIRNGVIHYGEDTYEEKMEKFNEETKPYISSCTLSYGYDELLYTGGMSDFLSKKVMDCFSWERVDFSKNIPRQKDFSRSVRQYCPMRNCFKCGKLGGGHEVAYRPIYGADISMRNYDKAIELGIEYRSEEESVLCLDCLKQELIRIKAAKDVIANRSLINKLFTLSKHPKEGNLCQKSPQQVN